MMETTRGVQLPRGMLYAVAGLSALEAAIVVALGAFLLWDMARERTALISLLSAGVLLLAAHLPHLPLLLWLFS